MAWRIIAAAFAAASCIPASAQTDAELQEQITSLRLMKERNQLQEEVDAQKAKRINDLPIPSFEGKADLDSDAANLEASVLSLGAVEAAAETIAGHVKRQMCDHTSSCRPNTVLLLAGAEPLDFGLAQAMDVELRAVETLFDAADTAPLRAATPPRSSNPRLAAVPVEAAVALANVVGGLLRSDVAITGAKVEISDATLAAATAASLDKIALMPSQAIASVPAGAGTFVGRWNALAARRVGLATRRMSLGAKPEGLAKQEADAIDAAITRFDSFAAQAAKTDANGSLPLIRAARLQLLEQQKGWVLRVTAVQAGGTVVKTKNIATTFGVDPLKVSGGLIARYTLTDPRDGFVKAAGVIACRTTLARLRAIHEMSWRLRAASARDQKTKAACS